MAGRKAGHHYYMVILNMLTGSRAYGTSMIDSDFDYVKAYVGPLESYLGISPINENVEKVGDTTAFEIKKFVSMCVKFNPNVALTLWSTGDIDPNWSWLKDRRNLFLSHRVVTALIGFSEGEMSRAHLATGNHIGAKGKALVDQYGFNTKSVQNAIRLSRMCLEFVESGGTEINLFRQDAGNLLDIRNGKVSLADCRDEYAFITMMVRAQEDKLNLPDTPDVNIISHLMTSSMKAHFDLI